VTVLERCARPRAGVVPAAPAGRDGALFSWRNSMLRKFGLLACAFLAVALVLGVVGCFTSTRSGESKMESQNGKMDNKMDNKMNSSEGKMNDQGGKMSGQK
jgi:hypothetical protein